MPTVTRIGQMPISTKIGTKTNKASQKVAQGNYAISWAQFREMIKSRKFETTAIEQQKNYSELYKCWSNDQGDWEDVPDCSNSDGFCM